MSNYVNRQPPENNHQAGSPLPEFFTLLAAVTLMLLALLLILSQAVNYFGQHVPFSWEQPFALKWSEQRQATPAQRKVEQLTERLLQQDPLPDPISITVTVLDNAEPNAFAGLGGEIVIHRGLLEALPNENALALVLAHEIAHVRQRHVVKTLTKAVGVGAILAALGDGAGMVFQSTTEMSRLAFSREDEAQADELAVRMLQRYYGHTEGAAALFEVLTSSTPQWLSSHPASGVRRQGIMAHSATGTVTPLAADYLNFTIDAQ
ncbi:M48 family metallopeptidase [uncultured Ferrimonas sp.]|uniref:M48 family metallopeptidase n=1 Tax=uncultured Ferrimonas sp. TaxID=432640 RepID=UPI00262EECFF|nr:M48 family metallopeptidase [uncultured Ferrimonas sp.]